MSKSIIFLVESFLGNFYRHLAIFFWSHWLCHNSSRWNKSLRDYWMGQPWPLVFFFLFNILQKSMTNSNYPNRRRSRWPLDQHYGPLFRKYFMWKGSVTSSFFQTSTSSVRISSMPQIFLSTHSLECEVSNFNDTRCAKRDRPWKERLPWNYGC